MSERVYHPASIDGNRAWLDGAEAHHLARVRRSKPGDPVELFDGRGHAFQGRVEEIAKGRVRVVIDGPAALDRPVPVSITLASAVPKGDRFDWLVEKATELGVDRLVPIRTERSVVDPRSGKLDRLRRRVVEACKQCGRNRLLELCEPRSWADLIAAGPDGIGLLAHPGAGVPIGRFAASPRVTVAIGPEGGFTAEEVDRAIEAGWRPIELGPTVLRIETAGLAACAALSLMADD